MEQVFDHNSKTITVITDAGAKISVQSSVFANLCVRKDGGLTVWGDGRSHEQTVRVDVNGTLIGRNRRPIGAKKKRVSKKRSPRYPVKVTME